MTEIGFALLVGLVIGAGVWAFLTVVGVMQARLGLSFWDSVAILTLASFIFGSSGARGNRS